MSSSPKVTIKMNSTTVSTLQSKNYNLVALRVVGTSQDGGLPAVWFSTGKYFETTPLSWVETYGAFVSNGKITSGAPIAASCQRELNLGKKMMVLPPLRCQDPANGSAGCISVMNKTNSEIPSCGIIEKNPDGDFAPVCAFPLLGSFLILIKPIQKVLLTFASKLMVTNTVIAQTTQSIGPGLLIDLTQNPVSTVSYDATKGWTWIEKEAKAELIPAGTKLAPHLIILSEDLREAAKGKH